MGAAAIETLVGAALEVRRDDALRPLKRGHSGAVTRVGGVLSGPLPLALRLAAGHVPRARQLAAYATLIGSMLTRVGWLAAGRESATQS